MMLERGLTVDHSTVYRWVQAYAPELDKRCPTGVAGAVGGKRKGQIQGVAKGDIRAQVEFVSQIFGIAA